MKVYLMNACVSGELGFTKIESYTAKLKISK